MPIPYSNHLLNFDLTEIPPRHYVEVFTDGMVLHHAFCDMHGGLHDVMNARLFKVGEVIAWRKMARPADDMPAAAKEKVKVVKKLAGSGEGFHSWI